mmetsp:Transcript_13475/g.22113  ORF Transcript_13475/g.22113 Transcript_13475/m.22113 type:complete len:240 (+) Transcript_13475:784-1503(+)
MILKSIHLVRVTESALVVVTISIDLLLRLLLDIQLMVLDWHGVVDITSHHMSRNRRQRVAIGVKRTRGDRHTWIVHGHITMGAVNIHRHLVLVAVTMSVLLMTMLIILHVRGHTSVVIIATLAASKTTPTGTISAMMMQLLMATHTVMSSSATMTVTIVIVVHATTATCTLVLHLQTLGTNLKSIHFSDGSLSTVHHIIRHKSKSLRLGGLLIHVNLSGHYISKLCKECGQVCISEVSG